MVEPVLCEDGRTIIFFGEFDGGEFIASVVLPFEVDEAAFIEDEWRGVQGLHWRPIESFTVGRSAGQ